MHPRITMPLHIYHFKDPKLGHSNLQQSLTCPGVATLQELYLNQPTPHKSQDNEQDIIIVLMEPLNINHLPNLEQQ